MQAFTSFLIAAAVLASAALLPLASADTPAALGTHLADRLIYIPIRGQSRSQQHPGGAAPSEEALTRIFYEKAPEHAGKPVVIEYGWAAEHKMQPQADGRARSVPTGRRVGIAKVQERTLYERHRKRPVLGGGALEVHFEPETGRILQAGRAK